MKELLITVLFNTLRQMPSVVTDVENAIKTIEDPGAKADKVKALIKDVTDVLGLIESAI